MGVRGKVGFEKIAISISTINPGDNECDAVHNKRYDILLVLSYR